MNEKIFITNCYINKNTPSLIEKLINLGYYQHPNYINNENFIYAGRGMYNGSFHGYIEEINNAINCYENENLFIALAALSLNSNEEQWFIDPLGYWHINPCELDGLRKATIKELIEHFK